MTHTIKSMTAYAGYETGGLFDVAQIKLAEGYSIVSDEELLKLRTEGNPEVAMILDMCRAALVNRRGETTSAKGAHAVWRINQFLGKVDS